jgi:recombination associated protein RdgC
MLLFRHTFDRPVTPASAGEVAGRWAARVGEARAYDDVLPACFVNPADTSDERGGEAGDDDGRSKDFLGTEWLTWLWYTSHVESSEITASREDSIAVLFEKSLQLECAFKLSGSTAIRADAPTRLPEAPVALAGGKRPVRAGLQIALHGDAFSFGLRGDVMHFSGVRLPPPEDVSSPRDVFVDRIEKLRDLIGAVEALYSVFLKRRLSSKWPQTLNAMRSWIAAGRYEGATFEGTGPAALEAAS